MYNYNDKNKIEIELIMWLYTNECMIKLDAYDNLDKDDDDEK